MPRMERPHEWSGSLRRHNYLDLALYLVFVVLFCTVELQDSSSRASNSYHLVQSVQSGLLTQARLLLRWRPGSQPARCGGRAHLQLCRTRPSRR